MTNEEIIAKNLENIARLNKEAEQYFEEAAQLRRKGEKCWGEADELTVETDMLIEDWACGVDDKKL
jgi:hypothetical protein